MGWELVLVDGSAIARRVPGLARRTPAPFVGLLLGSAACGLLGLGLGALPVGLAAGSLLRRWLGTPNVVRRSAPILVAILVTMELAMLVPIALHQASADRAVLVTILLAALGGATTAPVHAGAVLGCAEGLPLAEAVAQVLARSGPRLGSVVLVGAAAGALGVGLPACLVLLVASPASYFAVVAAASAIVTGLQLLVWSATYEVVLHARATPWAPRSVRAAWSAGPPALLLGVTLAHALVTPARPSAHSPFPIWSSGEIALGSERHFDAVVVRAEDDETLIVVGADGRRIVVGGEALGFMGLPPHFHRLACRARFRGHDAIAVGVSIDGFDAPGTSRYFDLTGARLDDTLVDRIGSRCGPVLGIACLLVLILLLDLRAHMRPGRAAALALGAPLLETPLLGATSLPAEGTQALVRGTLRLGDSGSVERTWLGVKTAGEVRVVSDDGVFDVSPGLHPADVPPVAPADGDPALVAVLVDRIGSPTPRAFPGRAAAFFAIGSADRVRETFLVHEGLRLARRAVPAAVCTALACLWTVACG